MNKRILAAFAFALLGLIGATSSLASVPGSALLTATPVDFSRLIIAARGIDTRLSSIQIRAGDTIELYIGSPECCYFIDEVEVDTTWSAEPSRWVAVDDPIGSLIVNHDAAIEPFRTSCSGRPYVLAAGQAYQHDITLIKTDLVVTGPAESEMVLPPVPTFAWEAYPDAAYYEISIFRREPSYEATIYEHRTTNTILQAPVELGVGMRYGGWVVAYNALGTPVATGDIHDFDVE